MNAANFIESLLEKEIKLWTEGMNLRIGGECPRLSEQERGLLRFHKSEVLSILRITPFLAAMQERWGQPTNPEVTAALIRAYIFKLSDPLSHEGRRWLAAKAIEAAGVPLLPDQAYPTQLEGGVIELTWRPNRIAPDG